MTQELLESIFGLSASGLTPRELAIIDKVANWYDKSIGATIKAPRNDSKLIEACRYALKREGARWESVMLNRTRRRKVLELRNVIILIVCKRVKGSQSYKARLLGGMLDRTSLIHAVKTSTDWIEYDKGFKALYTRINTAVDKYLNKKLWKDYTQ